MLQGQTIDTLSVDFGAIGAVDVLHRVPISVSFESCMVGGDSGVIDDDVVRGRPANGGNLLGQGVLLEERLSLELDNQLGHLLPFLLMSSCNLFE